MDNETTPQENEPVESLTSPSEIPLNEGDTSLPTDDVKPEKHLKITYHDGGNVEVESVDVAVFDLWGLSRYMGFNPLNCIGDADDEDTVEKYIYVSYHDGMVAFETNKMRVVDILALSRYLELTGDRMYINKEVENNARAQMKPQIIHATAGAVRGLNREQRRHGKEN